MDYMKDLLFNLIILLLTLLVFQMIFTNKVRFMYSKYKLIVLTSFLMLQIMLSLYFAIELHNQFIFDFRFIPIILGGLYGGPRVSIALFIFVNLFRIPFGGIGIINNLVVSLVVTIIICLIYPKFKKMDLRNKLLTVTLLSIFFSMFSFIVPHVFFGFTMDANFIFLFTFVQTLGMLILTYSTENIIQNYFLRTELFKSEKMEVVSHLAASISHEVRNPLTVTRGFLQLLKEPKIDEEKRNYYLDTALAELDRAEIIISDYLTFAKPHPNEMKIISIKDVIQKATELIIPYANQYSVHINEEVSEDANVKGEATKLQQCLINILKNCIEAMPSGGKLSIRSETIREYCYIHVIDTGHGMTKEQVARLGEPYFSTKEGKGTGLGMMVVYRIIESMGGSIQVSSTVGTGTHFIITLPKYME